MLQSKLIDLNNSDFIGRHETFESDVAFVMKTLDISFETIPRKNPSKTKGYKQFYSPKSIDRVAKMYAKDINKFQYSWEK